MSFYRYSHWSGTEGGRDTGTGQNYPETWLQSSRTRCSQPSHCLLILHSKGPWAFASPEKNHSQNRRLFSAATNCWTATVLSILCLHSIYAERGQITRRHTYYYFDRMRVTFVCKKILNTALINIARVGYCTKRQHPLTQRLPHSNNLRRISTVVLWQQGQDQPQVWIREVPHSPGGSRALRYRDLPMPCNIFVVIS